MSDLDVVRDHARALGVETFYWDVNGGYHDTTETTLRAVVEVLEADHAPSAARRLAPVVIGTAEPLPVDGFDDVQLVLADGTAVELTPSDGWVTLPPDLPFGCHRVEAAGPAAEESATVVVAPPIMPRDAALDGGSGLFVPTYALWEPRASLPSFALLGAFAAACAGVGIDVVSTLPLYAAYLDDPFDPSPYAPVSRLHWNEVYIDDAALPSAPRVVAGDLIDWPELSRRRRRQLLDAAGDLDPYLDAAIARFVAARPDVADFARFRAACPDPTDAGRPSALVERSHVLAQYLADHQLAAVEGPERALLALDLPIGSHPEGYERAAFPELFAGRMTVGAPPDEFFVEGQDWGFPPQLPGAGRRSGHDLWRRVVTRAGEHASVLRIDHVMGVERLWWIPEGAGATDGTYVRYPREELLAVIAAAAAVTATTIVGENLGTVPDEVREALERWDVLGLYEEQFELYGPPDRSLPPVPARSVAGIRTHDMPAFGAAYGGDTTGAVQNFRHRLAQAAGRPIGDDPGDVLDAVIERLAASDAYLVVADVDDLIGETRSHNVPGQVLDSTWRRRLARPASGMLADGEFRRRLKLLSTRPRRGSQ